MTLDGQNEQYNENADFFGEATLLRKRHLRQLWLSREAKHKQANLTKKLEKIVKKRPKKSLAWINLW